MFFSKIERDFIFDENVIIKPLYFGEDYLSGLLIQNT